MAFAHVRPACHSLALLHVVIQLPTRRKRAALTKTKALQMVCAPRRPAMRTSSAPGRPPPSSAQPAPATLRALGVLRRSAAEPLLQLLLAVAAAVTGGMATVMRRG